MTGAWLIASLALGRPAANDDPYLHVCGSIVRSPAGRDVKLWRRDCARCSVDEQRKREQAVADA